MSVATEVKAEFYKMLLYEKGSHFKRHRDNAKVANMFASLVFVLPSAYSGGELIGYHNGKAFPYLKNGNEVSIRYASWFCDIEHEILPITDGHRIVLVYNLLSTSKTSTIPKPFTTGEEANAARLKEMVGQWEGNPEVFVLRMSHQYTPEQQKLINSNNKNNVLLKGMDAVLVNKVRKHLNDKVVCFVCTVQKTAEYEAEGGGYGGHLGEWGDPERGELIESDFSVVINGNILIDVEEENCYGFDLDDELVFDEYLRFFFFSHLQERSRACR